MNADWHEYVILGLGLVGSVFTFLCKRIVNDLDDDIADIKAGQKEQWQYIHGHSMSIAGLEERTKRL